MRPMAECDAPHDCPDCAAAAARDPDRAAPRLHASRRAQAHATNERSAHAPTVGGMQGAHGAGCGCCSTASRRGATQTGANGAKAFPTARPWMISH